MHRLHRHRRSIKFILIVLALLFLGVASTLASYLFWRFRFRQANVSFVIRDEATQTEQQVITETQPGQLIPEELIAFRKVATIDRARAESAQLSYLKSNAVRPDFGHIDKYELIYIIEDEQGQKIPVKASVYIPSSGGSQKPWYVFAAGTSGLAAKCAPSLEQVEVTNIGNYENQMISQASENYVVIFPEYVGFYQTNDLQPYFISEMEARVMLGAIANFAKVAQTGELVELQVGDIYLTGYSQGGHAALSSAARRDRLDENIRKKVKGVIGYASASDVIALLSETPRLGPYVLYSYFNYYGPPINLTLMLQQQWLDSLTERIENTCIDRTNVVWPNIPDQLYTPEFAEALRTNSMQSSFPSLYDEFKRNMTFDNLEGLPIYQQQGATDPIVWASTQVKNQREFCEKGYDVLYQEYAGINHYQVRQAGFYDGVQWMNAVSSGRTPANNCPDFNSY